MRNSDNSSPTLTNVTFSGNFATHLGGGMFNDKNSRPTLINNTFNNNSAERGGGLGSGNITGTLTLRNTIPA